MSSPSDPSDADAASTRFPRDSVGLVTPQRMIFDTPLKLEGGKQLDRYELVYETYGSLNSDRSNAILVCHALSGDHHAAGYHTPEDRKPGWWDVCIGPGKPFDTRKFFVVSLNNLGGCKGSTGPNSINPETGVCFGPDFPIVTVGDWVNSQRRLGERLGIQQWAAVAGGSLGGMQVMQWAIHHSEAVRHALIIAATPKLSAQNIAFNEVARQAILSDPDFHEGRYEERGVIPRRGLMLARMLGHITYLSEDAMRERFGRELRAGRIQYGFDVEFQVESYLRHQGTSFVDRFDANTYLLMTKALDYFDPAQDFNGSLAEAFKASRCRFLVASFTSDWRFSSARSREIVNALMEVRKPVCYADIRSTQGHDDFLMPNPEYLAVLQAYMRRVAAELPA
ncbi:MAG TPA: homoserine O-acetyltransferase [Candidatus Acidoferrales bacterium]|nr:homoserine O-acetyltransferase [Candidatus Acidoferrales bacterium]